MLDFLQYVADGSIDAVAINGIDYDIIGNGKYHEELARQIKRVLSKRGIVFGVNSEALGFLKKDKDIETLVDTHLSWQKAGIFEKK